MWALPYGGALGKVLTYRKALFDQYDVPYPTADWTWDHLLEAARAMTDYGKGHYGVALGAGKHESWYWVTFLWSAGGEVMVQDPKDHSWRCVFNGQGAAEALWLSTPEFQFRDWLRENYGGLGRVNWELGLDCKRWADLKPPQQQWHYAAFLANKAQLCREFLFRNFITAVDYLALHGRGIYNTIVYCTLAVVCALIVNPLAAYALSRYQPPSTHRLLLFFTLTMAFPPMVTQIPVFLMLREMSLLNSYWALILPGLAQGYSVFLLKRFFDSLPSELYECAEIDGANEFRIFWQITISMSKPIMAVFALSAFTAAYSNFIMALLLCQDQEMWTLMPWLYQLQQRSGEGVIFASLMVAAVPTFLIFLLCQKVIVRGIAFPVER